jgi:hypothetical protein
VNNSADAPDSAQKLGEVAGRGGPAANARAIDETGKDLRERF